MRIQCSHLWFAALVGASGCVGTLEMTPPDGAKASGDLAMMAKAGDMAGAGMPDLAMAIAMDDLAMAAKADLAMGAYPPGPYGNDVGQIFPPLKWEGYVDDAGDAIANTKPYIDYSMDDARRSGRPYAMIHVSEFI